MQGIKIIFMRIIYALLFMCSVAVSAQNSYENGVKHFKRENLTAALLDFKNISIGENKYWKAQEYIGDVYAKQENWDESVEVYENLVETFPQDANFNFKYGGALGMKALTLSKMEAAFYISDIKYYLKKAAQLDENHIEARWALAKLYMQLPGILGGNTSTAYKYTDELLQISPVDGWLAKGYVATEDKDFQAAEKYYKNALTVGGSITCYQELIHFYENKINKKEQAQQLRKEAQEKHPSYNWTNI